MSNFLLSASLKIDTYHSMIRNENTMIKMRKYVFINSKVKFCVPIRKSG